MAHYRKVSDDEISPYMGFEGTDSPQAKRAQNRKRADVRRLERPEQPPEESDLLEGVTAVVFVVGMVAMFIFTLASV